MTVLKVFLGVWLAITVLLMPDCDSKHSAIMHVLTAIVCLIGLIWV